MIYPDPLLYTLSLLSLSVSLSPAWPTTSPFELKTEEPQTVSSIVRDLLPVF